MPRWLLAPFVAVVSFLAWTPEHRAYLHTVNTVSESIVRLTGGFDELAEGWVCTGSVVGNHLVLTAAHCIYQDTLVDDATIRGVVRIDSFLDLALVDAKVQRPVLPLRTYDPVRFESLLALGYAYGTRHVTVLRVTPWVLHYTPYGGQDVALPPGIFVEGAAYVGGMSGGPVVDQDGQLVSIVQRACGLENQGGCGVAVKTIREFLQGVL